MIVQARSSAAPAVRLDVHKHSLTAVAVDELGRTLAEHAGPVDEQVLVWARSLDEERQRRGAGAGAAAPDGAAASSLPPAASPALLGSRAALALAAVL